MKVVSVSYVVVVFNVRMKVLYFYIIRAETRTDLLVLQHNGPYAVYCDPYKHHSLELTENMKRRKGITFFKKRSRDRKKTESELYSQVLLQSMHRTTS